MTLLHIKYIGLGSCRFRQDLSMYFHYTSMADSDASWAWPVWTPGTR